MSIDIIINRFDELDRDIISKFLREKEKASKNTYNGYKSTLEDFFTFANKNIEEIKINDILDYFNYLECRTLKYRTKVIFRSRLNNFFKYCQTFYLLQQKIFINPIPDKAFFQFSRDELDLEIDPETELFSEKELLEILELALKKDLKYFIMFALLVVCGMRISEMTTIKLMNVNLKKRYIITGIVKNAKKQNRPLIFFIPEKFVSYLKLYIAQMDQLIYLFPAESILNDDLYYKPVSLRQMTMRSFDKKYARFHKYRKTLITNRILNECPPHFSELLTNHKVNTTQFEFYIKISLEKRRELYDKYFPYYHFPYF